MLRILLVTALATSLAWAQETPERILQQAITLHQSGDPEQAIPKDRA